MKLEPRRPIAQPEHRRHDRGRQEVRRVDQRGERRRTSAGCRGRGSDAAARPSGSCRRTRHGRPRRCRTRAAAGRSPWPARGTGRRPPARAVNGSQSRTTRPKERHPRPRQVMPRPARMISSRLKRSVGTPTKIDDQMSRTQVAPSAVRRRIRRQSRSAAHPCTGPAYGPGLSAARDSWARMRAARRRRPQTSVIS